MSGMSIAAILGAAAGIGLAAILPGCSLMLPFLGPSFEAASIFGGLLLC